MNKQIMTLCIFHLVLGLCFLSLYVIIGSYVDEQGILHEPFILIPAGGFFLLLSLMSFVAALILLFAKKLFAKKRGFLEKFKTD